MAKILALDLATTTGWAFSYNGVITSGTISFKSGRYEGGGMRYLRFRNWIAAFLEEQKPDVVYFEEVRRHMSTDAAHVHGGLLAQLTAECEARTPKVPYQSIPVGTIKKTATGKGNATKDMMIASAKAKWPHQNIEDDNQADALWILETGRTQ